MRFEASSVIRVPSKRVASPNKFPSTVSFLLEPALEATQGLIDGFFGQFTLKRYQNREAYVGD